MTVKKKDSIIIDPENPEVPYTQPVEPPDTEHARYTYEYGDMRRCHLCGAVSSHMQQSVEEVWFPTLEHRARHILEVHRDCSIELQRAKEVLGIADLWNSKAPAKATMFKIPIIEAEIPNPIAKNSVQTSVEDEDEEEVGFFKKHKIISVILAGIALWVIYSLYLMFVKGYSF